MATPRTITPAETGSLTGSLAASTFSPTVTLVGGAGNTVPVYSTNSGRYTRIGNVVFCDVYLTGDGGAEGAGTGQINILLPVAAASGHDTSFFQAGYLLNNTTEDDVFGLIAGSATTVKLSFYSILGVMTSLTGAEQNNATRTIRLKFFYEV